MLCCGHCIADDKMLCYCRKMLCCLTNNNNEWCLVDYKCCVVDDRCCVVDNKFSVLDDKCCVFDNKFSVVDDKCCVVDEEVCAGSCVRVRNSGNQGVVPCFASKYIIMYQNVNMLSSFCLQGGQKCWLERLKKT